MRLLHDDPRRGRRSATRRTRASTSTTRARVLASSGAYLRVREKAQVACVARSSGATPLTNLGAVVAAQLAADECRNGRSGESASTLTAVEIRCRAATGSRVYGLGASRPRARCGRCDRLGARRLGRRRRRLPA